ncbi:MAG: alpha/beta-type small acid-soluble spore protein [Firmicutes bacterium]|nr:alpha/beta-type small acid-soluble spore protein [Bacillota bacterium]
MGYSFRSRNLIPQAYQALNQFKYEVAKELGFNPHFKTGYWGNISPRECGPKGGPLFQEMIAATEKNILQNQPFGCCRQKFGDPYLL